MDAFPPPPPFDPALRLQRDIHLHAADTLRRSLPRLVENTQEARNRRDRVAFASVASLVPGNPAEGRIAANHVAAMEHASQCLAEVAEFLDDPKQVARLRAQAASMGREARGYLGALQRMQAIRLKRESKDTTRESAAWTEHCMLGNMTQALEGIVGAPGAEATPAAWVAPGDAGPVAEVPEAPAGETLPPCAPVAASAPPAARPAPVETVPDLAEDVAYYTNRPCH